MSASEGLIDIRDVSIVIGLSWTLSNPLPHLSGTIAVSPFCIQSLGKRPSSLWHRSREIETVDLKKKTVSFIASKIKQQSIS